MKFTAAGSIVRSNGVSKFKPQSTSYLSNRKLAERLDKARRVVEQANQHVHRSQDLISASKKAVARSREMTGGNNKEMA